jgi:hypothetical protein
VSFDPLEHHETATAGQTQVENDHPVAACGASIA